MGKLNHRYKDDRIESYRVGLQPATGKQRRKREKNIDRIKRAVKAGISIYQRTGKATTTAYLNRNYVVKLKNHEKIKLAKVYREGKSLGELEKILDIGKATLSRHFSGETLSTKRGRQFILGVELENTIALEIQNQYEIHGIYYDRDGIRDFIQDRVDEERLLRPELAGWTPSDTFISDFLNRHALVYRKGQALCRGRSENFSKFAAAHLLTRIDQEIGFLPKDEEGKPKKDNIIAADETSVVRDTKGAPKVVAGMGVRNVHLRTADENSPHFSLVGAVSAAGEALSPMVILPRKTEYPKDMRERILEAADAPPDTLLIPTETASGFMDGPALLRVMKHLRKHCPENERLLIILDGHESRKYKPVLDYVLSHNMQLLILPPHCSHKIQVCDVTIYKPYKTELAAFWVRNKDTKTDAVSILRACSYVWKKIATAKRIRAGFRKMGLDTITMEVVVDAHTDEEFAPSNEFISQQRDTMLFQNEDGTKFTTKDMGITLDPPRRNEIILRFQENNKKILEQAAKAREENVRELINDLDSADTTSNSQLNVKDLYEKFKDKRIKRIHGVPHATNATEQQIKTELALKKKADEEEEKKKTAERREREEKGRKKRDAQREQISQYWWEVRAAKNIPAVKPFLDKITDAKKDSQVTGMAPDEEGLFPEVIKAHEEARKAVKSVRELVPSTYCEECKELHVDLGVKWVGCDGYDRRRGNKRVRCDRWRCIRRRESDEEYPAWYCSKHSQ